jgi:hypothetical protein
MIYLPVIVNRMVGNENLKMNLYLIHYCRLNFRVKKNHLSVNKVCGISAIC